MRVLGHKRLQLAHEGCVAAEGELRLDPLLERLESQLLETHDLPTGELLVGKLGKRRTAPERERLPQTLERAVGRERSRLGNQLPEAIKVELSRLDPDQIAARPGDDDVFAKGLAELRYVYVEPFRGRVGWPAAPQQLHQPCGGNDLVRPQEQDGEQSALPGPGHRNEARSVAHLEWTEHCELHATPPRRP
jgi:hypothetical protein